MTVQRMPWGVVSFSHSSQIQLGCVDFLHLLLLRHLGPQLSVWRLHGFGCCCGLPSLCCSWQCWMWCVVQGCCVPSHWPSSSPHRLLISDISGRPRKGFVVSSEATTPSTHRFCMWIIGVLILCRSLNRFYMELNQCVVLRM